MPEQTENALAYARRQLAALADDKDPVAAGMRMAYREMAALLADQPDDGTPDVG